MWKQLKELGKHTLIYGLGNMATSLLGFLLLPLYTHHLTTAEFGSYSLLMTLYGILSLLVDAGMTNSVSRYYFGDLQDATPEAIDGHRQALVSTALAATVVTSAAVAAWCALTANWAAVAVFHQPSYGILIQLMAIALIFRGLTSVPLIYLRVTERSLAFAILTCLQLALFLGFNIVLVAFWNKGVIGIFYSLIASTAIYAVLLNLAMLPDVRLKIDTGLLKELLRFGLPFLPVLLFSWVVDVSDRYLLSLYVNMSDVGIYSLGYKYGQFMSFIVTAFTLGWVPIRFKILQLPNPQVIYGRIATFYVAGSVFCWLLLSFSSREIIRLTSPPQFHHADIYIAPVALGYLMSGLCVFAVTGMGVAKKSASMPFVAFVAAFLNVGLNIILIPRLGPISAAYTTLVAYVAMVAGSVYFSQQHYRIHYQYGRSLALIGLATLLIVASSYFIVLPPPLASCALKFLLLLVYLASIPLLGIVSRAEILRTIAKVTPYLPRPLCTRLRGIRLVRDYMADRTVADRPVIGPDRPVSASVAPEVTKL